MKKLTFILFSLTASVVSAQTVQDNTPVTLKGTLHSKTFPALDEYHKAATVPVFKLTSPIDFNDTDFGESQRNVKEMQTYSSGQKLPKSGCIVANGTLFSAHTAHHKTPVLFEIQSFKPCK